MVTISVAGESYEVASDEQQLSTEFIHRVWIRMGRPNELLGESSWTVVDAMMKVWFATYPQEVAAWRKNLAEEQSVERTPHEALKGGYFPISYPTRFYQMLKVYFKTDRLADRKTINKFVKRYPILKRTKYNI